MFQEISVEYNFDNGPEFEIALCKVFRIILPNKYGICRGFIVSKDGKTAGDDIIVYALDHILLGNVNWPSILADSLELELH